MSTKSVVYPRVLFPGTTIRSAFDLFVAAAREDARSSTQPMDEVDRLIEAGQFVKYTRMAVESGNVTLALDTSDEFFAELRKGFDRASVAFDRSATGYGSVGFTLSMNDNRYVLESSVSVTHPDRAIIERILAPFEDAAPGLKRPVPVTPPVPVPKPRIFIGHGGASGAWREVKDHLHELHHYNVETYETGSRTGHAIRDILDEMMTANTFAILVMSAEDEQADADGTIRARQNVVHETGLFQGRLGFAKTILLKARTTASFSNIDGIQYIEYDEGTVSTTFGFILAALKREFPGT